MRFFSLHSSLNPNYRQPTALQLYNAETNREKMYLMEQQRIFSRSKSIVDSLIQSYKDAKSEALQDSIVKSMRDYYTLLSPQLRKAVDPYIRQGPTSPLEQKERDWKRFNKPPPEPILDEAPGSELTNMNKQISYLFQVADYNRSHKAFLYGSKVVQDKVKMIGLPDGQVAIRNDKGLITVLSKQDLELKQLSEKYGIPVRDIILNQGVFDTGRETVVNANGKQYRYRETYAPFEEDPTKRRGSRLIDIQTTPKSSYDQRLPANLTSFLMEWKNPSTKKGTVKYIKNIAKKDTKLAEKSLSEIFPRYSFRVLKREETKDLWDIGWVPSFVPILSTDYEYAIIPILGAPIGLSDSTGKKYTFYYDQPNDIISNKWGKVLGSLESVREQISQSDLSKKGK